MTTEASPSAKDAWLKKESKSGGKLFYKTAVDVFARKGYHETTVDEVAQAAGVAKGTIYYHFENKEELYLTVIQKGIELFKEQLRQAMAADATTRDQIKNMINCQIDFFEQEQDLVSLFLTELFGNDPQRNLLASRMLAECLQIIRSCIVQGISDGTLRQVDPETTTSSLFGMIVISALHYTRSHLPIPRGQVGAGIAEIFFQGTGA